MKLFIEAFPGELEEKALELVATVGEIVKSVNPALAEELEKAIPYKESELKFPVLRGIQKREEAEYDRQMGLMVDRIIEVVEKGTPKKSVKKSDTDTDTDTDIDTDTNSDTDTDMEKSGPYIGPRGGKYADSALTIPWHEDAGGKLHIKGLQNHLKEKYGVEISLIPKPGDKLELSKIVVPKERRNEGIGSKVMGTILGFADLYKKTVTLDPSTDFGGTKSKLIKFYKRHGFVENKGKNKDYEISQTMYREPNVKKSESESDMEKAQPEKTPSPDYSENIVEQEEDRYEKVKRTLIGKGYVEADFEEGGVLYGKSTNELIEMIRDKRND